MGMNGKRFLSCYANFQYCENKRRRNLKNYSSNENDEEDGSVKLKQATSFRLHEK